MIGVFVKYNTQNGSHKNDLTSSAEYRLHANGVYRGLTCYRSCGDCILYRPPVEVGVTMYVLSISSVSEVLMPRMTGRAQKPQSIGYGHAAVKIIYNIFI
ncbi:hypothetical protein QTP88_005111 [Uroleucon formosanum]